LPVNPVATIFLVLNLKILSSSIFPAAGKIHENPFVASAWMAPATLGQDVRVFSVANKDVK
jgi:hypothetical protein